MVTFEQMNTIINYEVDNYLMNLGFKKKRLSNTYIFYKMTHFINNRIKRTFQITAIPKVRDNYEDYKVSLDIIDNSTNITASVLFDRDISLEEFKPVADRLIYEILNEISKMKKG